MKKKTLRDLVKSLYKTYRNWKYCNKIINKYNKKVKPFLISKYFGKDIPEGKTFTLKGDANNSISIYFLPEEKE